MISGTTRLAGLLGHPVGHSLSPAMHNSAMKHLGIDMCYVAFDVEPSDFGTVLEGMRSMKAVGTNITIPHKEAAFGWVDHLDSTAETAGAVNTVIFGYDGSKGYNTDIIGVSRTLSGLAVPGRRKAMVLGAGGAARGVICALLKEGFETVFVSNRTLSKAEALAGELSSCAKGSGIEVLPFGSFPEGETDLLVNATSLGLGSDPWPEDLLGKITEGRPSRVLDMVYGHNGTTALTRRTSSAGIPSLDGEEVLLWQGAAAFELFTGRDAPLDVMRGALREGRKVS